MAKKDKGFSFWAQFKEEKQRVKAERLAAEGRAPEPVDDGPADPDWLPALIARGGKRIVGRSGGNPDACEVRLPEEVAQFYRWSDGAEWADVDVMALDDLPEVEHLPAGIVVFATDIGGNGIALDLNRASRRTCPVVHVEHETGEVTFQEAPTFREFLERALA